MNSLNPQLPTLNISKCLEDTYSIKRSEDWERNFEINHKAFAEQIAVSIASKIIKDLGSYIKDPYNTPLSPKNKMETFVSFEIWGSKKANQIKELAQEAAKLQPFGEWIEHFGKEQQANLKKYEHRQDEDSSLNNFSKVDKKYFAEMMAIVGKIVENRLNTLLKEFASNEENSSIQFKVIWFQKSAQALSNPSNFNDNYISVESWIKNEEDLLQPVKNTSIDLHRKEQKALQNKRTELIVILSIAFFFSAIFSKQSDIMRFKFQGF